MRKVNRVLRWLDIVMRRLDRVLRGLDIVNSYDLWEGLTTSGKACQSHEESWQCRRRLDRFMIKLDKVLRKLDRVWRRLNRVWEGLTESEKVWKSPRRLYRAWEYLTEFWEGLAESEKDWQSLRRFGRVREGCTEPENAWQSSEKKLIQFKTWKASCSKLPTELIARETRKQLGKTWKPLDFCYIRLVCLSDLQRWYTQCRGCLYCNVKKFMKYIILYLYIYTRTFHYRQG